MTQNLHEQQQLKALIRFFPLVFSCIKRKPSHFLSWWKPLERRLSRAFFILFPFFAIPILFPTTLKAQTETASCPCENCPREISDNAIPEAQFFNINIFGIQNNDLAHPEQCVQKVGLTFTHSYVGDLVIELISPDGDAVKLIGPVTFSQGSNGQTDNRKFEVAFVPSSSVAVPDNNYESQWDNDQEWIGIGILDGSYYPYQGNLEDFNSGRVNGQWTLKVTDFAPEKDDTGRLIDFYVEFCDAEGLVCDPCLDPEDDPVCTFMIDPGEATVVPDEVFCVPIYAKNVAFLETMRFPLTWDASVLEYVIVDSFKIDRLAISDFNETSAAQGNLEFNYQYSTKFQDNLGLVVQDSTPIFQVCFRAIGGVGDSSLINASSFPPTAIDVNGMSMATATMDGTVKITVDSTADCVRAIQLCSNEPISVEKSRGKGFEENEAIATCAPNGAEHQSKWYKFDILQAGSLEFMVKPKGEASYGFSLYKNACPNAASSAIVDCKSGLPLIVGRAIGASDNPQSSFGELGDTGFRPTVATSVGETYYLLVDNFSENGIGFDLVFGGTALIGDQTLRAEIATPDILTCTHPMIQLDATNSNQGLSYEPIWTTDTGQINTLNPYEPTVSRGGKFVFAVTDNRTGCVVKDSVFVATDQVLPIAEAHGGGTLDCNDPTLQLNTTGSSNGAKFEITWTNLSEAISNLPKTNVLPVDKGGDYELKIENIETGCFSTDTVAVLEDFVKPQLRTANSAISCRRPIAGLTATSTTANVVYEWSKGNLASPLTEPMIAVNDTGYFVVKAIAPNGCFSLDSAYVQDDRVFPIADAGADLTLNCTNPSLNLDGNNSSLEPVMRYNWETQGGKFTADAALNSLTPSVDSSGLYILTVENTENGCISKDSILVDSSFTSPKISIEADTLLNCFEPVLVIDASKSDTGAIYAFEWFSEDGKIIENPATYRPSIREAGAYIFRIENTENGCVSSQLWNVVSENEAPIADAGERQTLNCHQPMLTLDGNNSSKGTQFRYQWKTDNGHFATAATDEISVAIDSAGIYTLTVMNTENGCSTDDSVEIDNDFIKPSISVPANFTLTCQEPTKELTATSLTENTAFTWLLPDATTQEQATIRTTLAGLYIAVATAKNGCTNQDSLLLDAEQILPRIEIATPDSITCTNEQVNLIGAASEQGEGFAFKWTTEEGTFVDETEIEINPIVKDGGFYYLQITNTETGCIAIDSVQVQDVREQPRFTLAEEPEIYTCANDAVELTAVTDIPNAIYEWKLKSETKSNTASVTATEPGIYSIIIINPNNNCSSLSSIEIFADTLSPRADAGPNQTLNCTVGRVELDASASSQGEEFSYIWTNQSNDVISNDIKIEADKKGLYSLIVVNQNNGCRAIDTVRVAESRDNPVADAGKDTVYCSGVEADVLDLVLGGKETSVGDNFTYNWFNSEAENIGTTIAISVNTADTFVLQVVNTANNCETIDSVVVFERARPILTITAEGGINCKENEITYLAESDIETAVVKWVGKEEINSPQLTVSDLLLGAEYVAFAQDTLTGCLGQSNVVRVTENRSLPLISAGEDTEINCADTLRLEGQILSAGIESVTTWRTEDGNIVTSKDRLNPIVDAAGTYILHIENTQNFCVNEDTILVITDQQLPTVALGKDTALTCLATTLNVMPDSLSEGEQFYYYWKDEANKIVSNEKTLVVEFAGVYQLLVVDSSNLCTKSDIIEVRDSLNPPTISIATPDPIDCINNQITLQSTTNIEGGLYEWIIFSENGHILGKTDTPSLTVDSAGTYQLEITNAYSGCVGTKNIRVEDFRTAIDIAAGADKTITCHNDTTVQIVGKIFTESPNLVFEWTSDNSAFIPIDSTLLFTTDKVGTYYLQVTDIKSACQAIDSFVIDSDTTPIEFKIGPTLTLDCAKETVILGDINDIGNPNYSYEWTTSEGILVSGTDQTAAMASKAGIYQIFIENLGNGCTYMDTQRVVENRLIPAVDVGIDQELTCVNAELIIGGDSTAMGSLFQYNWTTENGVILRGKNTPFATITAAGDYQLVVKDTTNACENRAVISIKENKEFPEIELPEGLSFACTDATLNIEPRTSENVSNLNINWFTETGTIQPNATTTLQTSVTSPGWYYIEIEDRTNSCVIIDSVLVADNRVIPTVTTLEDRMLGCTNTSITLSAEGSEIGDNIIYKWLDETGQTLSNSMNLTLDKPGQYRLEVINQENSCVNTDTVLVSENFDPPTGGEFRITSPTCFDDDNGSIEVTDVMGGTAPFRYALDEAEATFVSVFADLAFQTYTLTITDQLDCTWDTTIILNQPAAIDLNVQTANNQLITGELATFSIETSLPPSEIADIIWTPAEIIDCAGCSEIAAAFVDNTTIGVTVIDVNGCESTASLEVFVELAPVPNAITPNGDGSNDFFMIPAIERAPNAYPNSELIIFNRWGDVLYKASPYTNNWDGKNQNGEPLGEGTYYYILRLDTKEGEVLKGDITVLRR